LDAVTGKNLAMYRLESAENGEKQPWAPVWGYLFFWDFYPNSLTLYMTSHIMSRRNKSILITGVSYG